MNRSRRRDHLMKLPDLDPDRLLDYIVGGALIFTTIALLGVVIYAVVRF